MLVQDLPKSKVVKERVESMISKVDIRIDKGGNFGSEDVVVEEDNHQSFHEKESNHETLTVDDWLEYMQSKATSKEIRNVADDIDIRIEKDEYDSSGDDMMIEEDNPQTHQKEEHNLQTDAEDDDLANIWNEMTVALECSKVSAFYLLFMINKSFHVIFSLILLLKTYRLLWLPF